MRGARALWLPPRPLLCTHARTRAGAAHPLPTNTQCLRLAPLTLCRAKTRAWPQAPLLPACVDGTTMSPPTAAAVFCILCAHSIPLHRTDLVFPFVSLLVAFRSPATCKPFPMKWQIHHKTLASDLRLVSS